MFANLQKTLESVGAENILCKGFNTYSVNVNLFSCDLYDYDKGLPEAVNAYKGDFMLQYSWGEFVTL